MSVAHYQDIGTYLKDCRESLGYELDEISRQLNIRARYLKSIEAGDFESLPGAVYTEGYLRNYAEFLKLDSKEVIEKYKQSGQEGDVKVAEKFMMPEPYRDGLSPNKVILLVSAIGFIAIYAWWYSYNSSASNENFAKEIKFPETATMTEEELIVIGVRSGKVAIGGVENEDALLGMDMDNEYIIVNSDSDNNDPQDLNIISKKTVPQKVKEVEVLGWKTKPVEGSSKKTNE